ncbi:MAG: hypothetical protein KAR12_18285, partial [Methylococcales bacterium]|nr:hypothetical protein [Methylococcales bacterium]
MVFAIYIYSVENEGLEKKDNAKSAPIKLSFIGFLYYSCFVCDILFKKLLVVLSCNANIHE